jgi:phosphoribosyl 1,2-cyclic phosphate phosphodiesterase
MDCTNGILDLKYIGHMGINKNVALREKLLSIGAADENTVFVANHFSHNGLVSHEEMEKRLPDFTVSYDGMTLRV